MFWGEDKKNSKRLQKEIKQSDTVNIWRDNGWEHCRIVEKHQFFDPENSMNPKQDEYTEKSKIKEIIIK